MCILITESNRTATAVTFCLNVCYRVDLWYFVCNFNRCCGDTSEGKDVYVQMKTNLLLQAKKFMGLEIFAWVKCLAKPVH